MKRITTLILTFLLIGTMSVSAHAITPGKWDFEAGYAYAQKIAKEMAEEQETEKPDENQNGNISESQLEVIRKAHAECYTKAREFWKNISR